jgi:hypothetical protein
MSENPGPPNLEEQVRLAKDIDAIVDAGRGSYGARSFDEASQVVAEALGPQTPQAMAILRGFDAPHDVIMHLAGNAGRLAQFSKLPVERQAVEISRIEAQMSSHGHVSTGAVPHWRTPEARHGRVSDDEWRTTGGANLKDDKAWSREFDRRMVERNKNRNR